LGLRGVLALPRAARLFGAAGLFGFLLASRCTDTVLKERFKIMIIFVSLLVCLVGLLMYALTVNARLQEIGRICFFTGLLAFLLRLGPDTVAIFTHR
jgi:sugar phosphate permease